MPVFDKWALYDHPLVNWQPNPAQLKVAESSAQHKVLAGGRRLGKDNFAGTDKLLPEVFITRPMASTLLAEGKKRVFWIVGPSYQESEKSFRVIWNWINRLEIPMCKGSFNSPEVGLMQIRLWDGALEITAKSSTNPQNGLVGEGLSGAVMCEASKMKSIIWPKYIQPALADFNGWSYFGSTPEGKNWFYHLWQHARDPFNKDWQSWRMPSWVNPWVYTETGRDFVTKGLHGTLVVPPHELTLEKDVYRCIEIMKQSRESAHKIAQKENLQIDSQILARINDLPVELFMQEIAADFTEFVGRVFKDFDEETHVTDLQYNPGWETYAAIDYGYRNPNVWLLIQVGPWGEINVLDEVYQEQLDPEEFVNLIKYRQLNPPNLKYIFPDPASPGVSVLLERKLQVVSRGGTGGELNDRLTLIRQKLKSPRVVVDDPFWKGSLDGLEVGSYRPQLMFDRKCKRTIDDMLNYRYPDNADANEPSAKRFELPLKKDDHGPEALGRFMIGYFKDWVKGKTRVHEANFGSSEAPQRYDARTAFKSEEFRRPALHENKRQEFPKINSALGNFIKGAYDD